MDVPASHRPAKRQKTTASSLCTPCQSLHFDSIFSRCRSTFSSRGHISPSIIHRLHKTPSGTLYYADALPIHRFHDRLTIPTSCPLCQFFRSLRVQPEEHSRHKLLAFRSSDSWLVHADRLRAYTEAGHMQNVEDAVFLAVLPDIEELPASGYEVDWLDKNVPATGAIFCVSKHGTHDGNDRQPLLTTLERSEKADLCRVRSLLETCRREHGDACRRRTSYEPVARGFRVIDCDKDLPTVEDKPWGTRYAALSYVWGATDKDLKDWPETVLAAIEVTSRLGLRYLWVDRCCINQSDPEEKAYLISRMTTIYEAAQFTIVAAAGAGASHGLPGIRSTPRNSQPKYALDSGNVLLSMLPDPRLDILKSTYWTRGWTYQEGVLSNRRIVFTGDQFYWECRCMATHETVIMPLSHIPQTQDVDSDHVMADYFLGGIFKSDAFSGGSNSHQEDLVIENDSDNRLDYGFPIEEEANTRSQLRGFNEHIREFSKRRLTRDEDTLPAFQGILGLYEPATSITVLHGLPLWTGDITGGVPGVLVTFALTVSSWHHHAGLEREMFVSEACRRRRHEPSWTWAGWDGVVSWRAPPNLEHCAYMSDIIAATSRNLLWAADLYLYNTGRSEPIRLLGPQAAARLAKESPRLMEIRNPFVLNRFERVEETPEWTWTERKGRAGRQQYGSDTVAWNTKWYRIGRRLSFTAMSAAMSPAEWTAKHMSGELVSVLMFAGRFLDTEHGSARWLTLRRAEGAKGLWERAGTLYLTLPFLGGLQSSGGMFHKIPAARQHRVMVVR